MYYWDGKISYNSPLPKLYVTAWLPWYEVNLTAGSEPLYKRFVNTPDLGPQFADKAPVSAIELMAAKANAIYELIASRLRIERPFRALFRRQAEKDIVHLYTIDEWFPLFKGKSLKAYIEGFFDEKAAELAKSELVWFNSIS